jgi:hypothetical protein
VAYGAWLVSQHLLETTREPVAGFVDHTHEWLAGINLFLNAHCRSPTSSSLCRRSRWTSPP